jgi:hypothetical protein
MGYAEFKATLKKINLKPKGVKEIVLEISDSALYGKIDMLAEMLDSRVAIAVDSEIVRYNVQINARTEKPTTTYRVDDSGIVSEVKPEGEQMELDLGVPKTKEPVKDIPEEIGREVVDEFILSLLAPQYDDLQYPFYSWVARLSEGDTYLKIATEDGMASGKVIDLLDEYRFRVAPLAAKWDEWRQAKSEAPDDSEDDDQSGSEDMEEGSVGESGNDEEDIEMEDIAESNYLGKVVLFKTNTGSQLIFPIEGDYARAPKKYENGVYAHTMGEGQVFNEMGVRAVPISETGGWIGYLVSELISFGGELVDDTPVEGNKSTEDEILDWEQGIKGDGETSSDSSKPAEPVDVETIILTEKPAFEDIPYDFPTLLQRKKAGETWMDIANSIGTRSTILSAAWTKYKKRVAESRGGAA